MPENPVAYDATLMLQERVGRKYQAGQGGRGTAANKEKRADTRSALP